jgi:hypothetical protein
MWVDCLKPNSNYIQDFDGELQILQQCKQKQKVQVLDHFFSFMFSFQPHKAHDMLAMMLNPCYKNLGLVIQYVDKEKALHIVDEYDRQVLFPLLVWAYKFLNPTHASEKTPSFTFQSSQSTSLYDLMETNGDMAL